MRNIRHSTHNISANKKSERALAEKYCVLADEFLMILLMGSRKTPSRQYYFAFFEIQTETTSPTPLKTERAKRKDMLALVFSGVWVMEFLSTIRFEAN